MRRRADRKLFIDLPFELARGHAAWQPGLRMFSNQLLHPVKNPFWKSHAAWFFIARQRGRIVGRIGLLDIGNVPERPGAATFVMPDFIDDAGVVGALLEAVSERARQCGAHELIGPMNPNIHHDLGIQVDGFDRRNTIFMGYQPPYYARRLEAAGFRGIADLQAWSLYRDEFARDGRLHRVVMRLERRSDLRIRGADVKRFDSELELFHRLYSESFADHWGFVAPTPEEFRFIAGDIRSVLRQNMALIAEWKGVPVGFALSVPDLYAILPRPSSGRITPRFIAHALLRWSRVREVRVMIAGVLPTHRHFGLHVPLFYRMATSIFDLGFDGGEISWVMEGNKAMLKALPLLGSHQTKTYRLYSMPLDRALARHPH